MVLRNTRKQPSHPPKMRSATLAEKRLARLGRRLVHGLVGLVVLAAVALAPAPPAAAAQSPEVKAAARQVIVSFYDTLLAVMRNAKALRFDGRRAKLAPAVRASYNLPVMARASIGRQWRALTPAQRKTLVAAFSRMSVATYADRFDGYSGEKLEVKDVADGPRGTLLVRTHIVKSDGDVVKINYLMRKYDDKWRIIDVFLKGTISELATKRSDYGSVMRRQGFDALISTINAKVAAFDKS